jgi:hypothetical protein
MYAWLILVDAGERRVVDLKAKTRKGVLAAVKRHAKTHRVVAAFLGSGPVALVPCIWHA